MSYQLGLVSISFRDQTPEKILQAASEVGLSCIEWGSDVHAPVDDSDKLRNIVAMQATYGIRCCSYGTYFTLGVTPMEQLPDYIRAARILGTDILRLWCGNRNSEEYTSEEKEVFFSVCRQAAAIAEEAGVTLCMECHNNTFTNRKEAALELMRAVGSPHFQMYWQPSQYRTAEENVKYAALLAPYTHHLHVFNWEGDERYPLEEAVALWQQYLDCFTGDRTLLLEFMPDDDIKTLPCEVQALGKIAGGTL